jgi:carbamoyl-phosphate synthase/aspartate carbamoyltransferase/dihydroorotase
LLGIIGLGMPEYVKNFVASKGIEQTEYSSIEEVVEVADVLYVTRYCFENIIKLVFLSISFVRFVIINSLQYKLLFLLLCRIQEERFESEDSYRRACENYVINDKTMHRAKPGMRVLHPLPRKFEISPEFDTDERAAYFRQAENGLYVRMALLAMVLGAW